MPAGAAGEAPASACPAAWAAPSRPVPAVSIVLHDIAPQTRIAWRRLRRCVAAVAPSVPVSLLVVPRYHGQWPTRRLRRELDDALAAGDELVLHGYTHLDPGVPHGWRDRLLRRWYTAGEGEFAALDHGEASRRLEAGRAWFEQCGWPLHGFVPPAWLLGPAARTAVEAAGFEYTCSLSRLVALPLDSQRGAVLRSQGLVYSTRTPWRGAASLAWNAAVAWHQRSRPLLRFELHPPDVEHPLVRASWMRLLAEALDGREPMTLLQASRALRHGRLTGPAGSS